jgi:hypothetical protein
MSRMADLEARRLALLARCEAQRAELSQRIHQLGGNPRSWLGSARAGETGIGTLKARHPLAWIAALAGVLAFGRTREVLTAIVWARSALSLVARVTEVVSLASALRRGRTRGAPQSEPR